jgi:methyltransferase
MVALHTAVILLPPIEVLTLNRPFLPALATAAVALLALATALRIWTLRTLGKGWSVRVVPPDPNGIVTHGPYRYIRHPNYLAVLLEVFALPLFHTAWISCLVLSLLNAWILGKRIRTEEQVLSTLPAWRTTMADRARLLPGLF